MPLKPGAANIGANITELREHGTRPRKFRQILAIALDTARRSGADMAPKPPKMMSGPKAPTALETPKEAAAPKPPFARYSGLR